MPAAHKKKSIVYILLAVIAITIAAGVLYWNLKKKTIIKEKVQTAVVKKSNGLYNIEYSNLQLNEVTGNLSLTGIQLTYDSAQLQTLLKQHRAPNMVFTISADSIVATGVKTPQALLAKQIIGSKLQLLHPFIELLYTNEEKETVKDMPDKEVYRQVLGQLDLIAIDTVEIKQARLITRHLFSKKPALTVSDINIALNNIRIDSAANKDTTRILFAENIHVQADTIAWKSKDGVYHFTIDSFRLNTLDKSSYIKTLAIEPIYSETEFMQHAQVQKDRFHFTINQLQINGLQLQQLLNERFVAESISTNNSTFKIYRDLNLPHDDKSRMGAYPQQALMKMVLPIDIKKLQLTNCFVEYKERNAVTKMSGKVQFYHVHGTISNVTNRVGRIKADNKMVVDVQTDFLNTAPFAVKWVMYLMDPNGRFTVNGNMGAFNATVLNQIIEPMGPARVETGNVENLRFNLQGDNYTMKGALALTYNHLKVAMLKKDEDEDKLKKKGLVSAISNLFIKDANPQKGKQLRTVPITFTRDTKRSVFSFIWKSIFSGVKASVGIKK